MTIKFVNLHGHSTFSVFDGFQFPDKHIDAAIEKGMYSLALTDHGNMNGLVYQVLHTKKLAKQGIDFKPIFGVEAYYIDSYKEWTDKYGGDEDSDGVIEDEENRKQNKNKYAHLVLLAKNQKGYENLCKLISESHGKYFYRKPRIDHDLLKKYSEGIICLTACLAGPLAKIMWDHLEIEEVDIEELLKKIADKANIFKEIFGEDFYLEIQWNAIPEQHAINTYLLHISKEIDVKLVSTCDAHYPKREDWEAREIYKKLGWLSSGITPEWAKDLTVDKDKLQYELYIKSGDELFEEYKRYCEITNNTNRYDDQTILESIERSYEISEKIEKFFPQSSAKFPKFILKDSEDASQKLEELCFFEMKNLGLDTCEEYSERLRTELETIKSRNFCEYFLTMKEISDFAQKNYLTGPGRGSAAGSLIAYLLKITQLDPIKEELLFSRFLRKDAEGYPDIDYDVSDRDGLVTELMIKWGEDCVVPITNWNTLSIKSLTKDLAKLLDVPFQEVNEVTRVMDVEATAMAKNANDIKSGVYTPTVDEYIKYSNSFSEFLEKYPSIEQYLKLLEGQIRSQSRHAGGILVVDNIDFKIPLIRSKVNKEEKESRIKKGLQPYVYQTPWTEGQNVRHLEPMGFIKFDVLGLKTLSIIENTINLLLLKKNGIKPTFPQIKEFYNDYLHPDKLDKDNEEIMKNIYWEGKWAGIFQFTEEGVQKFCMQVKPLSIHDLSVITAIYRPGPLGAGVVDKYLEAKNNPRRIKYEHPFIKEVTESTYGFLIFQEQISMLAHKLGKNISQDEAELLRKVLTKKGTGKDEVKDKLKTKFIDGCIEKELTEEKVEEIWNSFELFAGYGFNKSHSVGYSYISYMCAWLLYNYPNEWLASFLDYEPEKSKEEANNIVRSLGYKIGDIDINISEEKWIPDYNGSLIQPINSIKGIGEKALEELLKHRPFGTFEELLFHPEMSYRKVTKKILAVLIKSGAANSLIKKFDNLKHAYMMVESGKPKTIKEYNLRFENNKGIGDFTDEEKIGFMVELCGIYPLREVINPSQINFLKNAGCVPLSEYTGTGKCWAIARKIEHKKTAKGKDYAVITFIDSTFKEVNVKCWSWRFENKVEINSVYLMTLDFDPKWGYSTKNFARNFKSVKRRENDE